MYTGCFTKNETAINLRSIAFRRINPIAKCLHIKLAYQFCYQCFIISETLQQFPEKLKKITFYWGLVNENCQNVDRPTFNNNKRSSNAN